MSPRLLNCLYLLIQPFAFEPEAGEIRCFARQIEVSHEVPTPRKHNGVGANAVAVEQNFLSISPSFDASRQHIAEAGPADVTVIDGKIVNIAVSLLIETDNITRVCGLA
jgi:hypothetical protein